MKNLVAVLCWFCSSVAFAEVYKCKTPEGRFEFQSAPCAAGSAGNKIEVKVLPPSNATSQGTARVAAGSQTLPKPTAGGSEKEQADQAFKNRLRLRAINDEIDDYQGQIRFNNQEMERELSNLRASKGISNNNLAGETRNIAISGEMEAVASKYSNKNKAIEVAIETLRQERTRLQR